MSENELFQIVLKGNQAAILFIKQLANVSHVIDDLVDKDREVDKEAVYALAWQLIVTIPNNSFYQANFERLNPVMSTALNDWFVATDIEGSPLDQDKRIAYILRDNLSAVLTECVLLIGGYSWMRQHAAAIRRFIHDEDYNQYVKELE